jgi:hypothetical protein
VNDQRINPLHKEIAALRAENERLREMLADKQRSVKSFFNPDLRLSYLESKMLQGIYKAFPDAIQFDTTSGVEKVRMNHIRMKLKPFSIGVLSSYGYGCCLTPLNHDALTYYVQK